MIFKIKVKSHSSAEYCGTGSDEEDRKDSNNEGEDGREEETPPLSISQTLIVLMIVINIVCYYCPHNHSDFSLVIKSSEIVLNWIKLCL